MIRALFFMLTGAIGGIYIEHHQYLLSHLTK